MIQPWLMWLFPSSQSQKQRFAFVSKSLFCFIFITFISKNPSTVPKHQTVEVTTAVCSLNLHKKHTIFPGLQFYCRFLQQPTRKAKRKHNNVATPSKFAFNLLRCLALFFPSYLSLLNKNSNCPSPSMYMKCYKTERIPPAHINLSLASKSNPQKIPPSHLTNLACNS